MIDETRSYESPVYKLIKIWLLAVGIITFIYIISYWFYYSNGVFVSFDDCNKNNILRNITHAYPPPLVNFMSDNDNLIFD